jgi:RHS repeat-associated protein
VASSGGGKILRDTTAKVTDFDAFGNVLAEELSTVGVDLTLHVERTFKNDTDRWVLGQLQTQEECSAAAMQSQCRTLTRTTTIHGEVDTEAMATDDGSAETKLKVTYVRDDFGNVTGITAEDAFGHHRATTIEYEPEGIFPDKHLNAAGHTSFPEFDAGLGVLTKWTDPNGHVTERKYDGFGRLGLEARPDGAQTSITLARTKDGGAWRVTQRTKTSGGADDVVEYDSLGRPIRWWWHGPATPRATGAPPRLMQEVEYDPRSGQIARRSVPVSEGTAESEVLFDVYEFDVLAREVRHTTPWKAITETAYDGLLAQVIDPLGNVTSTQLDPLGRPVAITDAAKGLTSYTYGPFGALYTVTAPGGALTRTTRDALGRVQKLEDPDRGTSLQTYNGFGELLESTDALGRVVTFEPDGLGRPKSRTDQKGAEVLTTTWTWDTAANGIGKLHKLASPDGLKTHSYNNLGQLEGLSLAVSGATLEGKLSYDQFGRVETITYPTPAGAPPFVVTQEYDPYGHVLKVRDDATTYWHLKDVDNAGRFREEVLGNDVLTERSYFADKQRLKSITTQRGATMVQSLAYEYDARLSLKSRTDARQVQNPTERFRYDALDRLTCAYFSVKEDPFAPCASSYGYAPNGNLTFKSDVGILSYNDPAHPHAVTTAGLESYGYDAVGNQVTRPGGVTVSYTPFDLPKTLTQAAVTVTFGYDGDQTRIRKTTPYAETLYFGELYERVAKKVPAVMTEHRYYIHSPERVVAVVTRGGNEPGTLYVHTDHLGSVDALTNETGLVVERRSYDAFGKRRSPVWGQVSPASFASKITKGFTGHESDELGLVNMKGRIFDPKLGRFLTTDPIVSNLYFGQSLNAYSYVFNNPLSYVDPSGFQAEDGKDHSPAPMKTSIVENPDGTLGFLGIVQPLEEEPEEGPSEAAEVGAAAPPTDVDTTGSSSGYDPQPVTTALQDWRQNPYVQVEGGFLAGLSLGMVPFGAVGQQGLDAADVLPHGTPAARRGLAVGQVVGGMISLVGGLTGEVLGGAATVTGIGALIGVPAMAVSTTLVVGGAANVAAGLWGLTQSMMSSGPGSSGSQATPTAGGAKRGPKTDPNAPHNATVRSQADALESEGNMIVAGGGQAKERLIPTPGGVKGGRRPDILYRSPNGELRGRNVGLVDSKGRPVPREQSALDDLNGPGRLPTDFVPYKK